MELLPSLVNVGAAGAVVAVVILFLNFMKEIRKQDAENNNKLTSAIDKLVSRIESLEDRFTLHDATEMEFLRGIVARFDKQKTQPRKTP